VTSRAGWRALRLLGGVALAAAALWTVFIKVDRAALWTAGRQAEARWVLAGLGSVLLTLVLVTVRWKLLLGPGPSSLRALLDAVVIGQAVNIVFPLRFGEGARVALTSVELGRAVGGVTVAMAVERVLDVAAFGAMVLSLATAGWLPQVFQRVVPTVLVVGLGTMGVALAVVRLVPALLGAIRGRFGGDSPAARWFAAQEGSARIAWSDIARGRRLLNLILLTALILVTSASTNLLIFRAFNLPVPPVTALVLLAVIQIGTAVVSVPGNIGVFHYLTVVTLATWRVPAPLALATAIVLHIVSLGPKVLLGAIAAASLRVRGKKP
jgi:uncharacterized membrane protein YbhN (UPF0104 family)